MHSLNAIFYYLLNSISITLSDADKNYTSWKFWVSLICQSLRWYSWCSTYGSHLTILLIFFLFVWIKYLTFYISKVLFLRYLKVLWFYKFDFLEQYLRELFNMASGFHFETKSSTSGSRAFICLHYWMEVSRLFFYHLKTSI